MKNITSILILGILLISSCKPNYLTGKLTLEETGTYYIGYNPLSFVAPFYNTRTKSVSMSQLQRLEYDYSRVPCTHIYLTEMERFMATALLEWARIQSRIDPNLTNLNHSPEVKTTVALSATYAIVTPLRFKFYVAGHDEFSKLTKGTLAIERTPEGDFYREAACQAINILERYIPQLDDSIGNEAKVRKIEEQIYRELTSFCTMYPDAMELYINMLKYGDEFFMYHDNIPGRYDASIKKVKNHDSYVNLQKLCQKSRIPTVKTHQFYIKYLGAE